MWTNSFVRAAAFAGAITSFAAAQTPASPAPKVFEAAQVEAVYRVHLDRDALLLESITEVIKQKGITDGHVMITAGSLQECTYHYVVSKAAKPNDVYKTIKDPMEIVHGAGMIADGQPHIHIALSTPKLGAFGGHLENGCKVLYLGEVTIMKYKGQALTRKLNEYGIGLLTTK